MPGGVWSRMISERFRALRRVLVSHSGRDFHIGIGIFSEVVLHPPSPVVSDVNVPSQPRAARARVMSVTRIAADVPERMLCRQGRDLPRAGDSQRHLPLLPGGGELCSPTHSPARAGSDSGLLSSLCHSPDLLTSAGAGGHFWVPVAFVA